jgi:hypothetical protein
MMRDVVRGAVIVVTVAFLAEIMVQTKVKMLSLDWAARTGPQPVAFAPPPPQAPPPPLRRMASAVTDWADAALEIVR